MKIKFRIFLLILLISPLFWHYLIGSSQKFLTEYSQTPSYVKQKMASILRDTRHIDEFRWNDITKDNRPLIGNFFYNKGRLIFDQLIIYLNLLNPRQYFQFGQIEVIPCLLFPISLAGIFHLLKNKQTKILLIGLFSCFFGFITGQQNIYFLLPTAIFYIYLAAYELSFWKKPALYSAIFILLTYNSFLFFRSVFIL